MTLKLVSSNKCAGGFQKVFEHDSSELKCKMKFAVFLASEETDKCPVLYWLSGLTCSEQNFITNAGSQIPAAGTRDHASSLPITSPRSCDVDSGAVSWDLRTRAGHFGGGRPLDLDATNYRMYSYVTQELPKIINANFPSDPSRVSISGHSMGGHGALVCALKNPGKYKAVSAFAPICNPTQCPWGQKAFSSYLGNDRSAWEAYDATALAAAYSGPPLDVLIDQGREDQFLSAGQLLPDNLIAACSQKNLPVVFRLHEGYDHSYYFISSFMRDHMTHHAKFLTA
uniref:S-formylglutathione hydrolase n=1 Tax=Tetraodon nigroviridis TaxID=99883 RepID=H3CFV0_TETNG